MGESVQAASQRNAARDVPAERSDIPAGSPPDARDVLLASADALEGEAICLAESSCKRDSDPLDWGDEEDAQATYEHWMWLAENLRRIADA